jgi:hypothetical protein
MKKYRQTSYFSTAFVSSCLLIFSLYLPLLLVPKSQAAEPLIFSIFQDLPMGYDDQVLKKNFYVNIGVNQGLKKGTILSVYRTLSLFNPYEDKKPVSYKVKIGELKVTYPQKEAAICILHKMQTDLPVLEVESFMIGDQVTVAVLD